MTNGGNLCPNRGFDPYADSYLSNPYPSLATARQENPVFYSPDIDHWIVTQYGAVRKILRDPATYSSRLTQSPMRQWPPEAIALMQAQHFDIRPILNNADPPHHQPARHFTRNAFAPKRIAWLEPHIRKIIRNEIKSIAPNGKADLINELFSITSARILMVFLGIPDANIDQIRQWSRIRTVLTWGNPTDDEIMDLLPQFIDYLHFCFKIVDQLEKSPRDDFISELLRDLQTNSREGIDKTTIVLTFAGLLLAGHEPTTNQAGLGLYQLLLHHEQWLAICDNPALIPNAVEEVLRYDSSNISWRRVTTREVDIAGVKIPADSQLLLMLGSANRDESIFENGEHFNIYNKQSKHHLSFSHGIHYCMGAPLARLELDIFFTELTKQLPSLRLCSEETVSYLPNAAHRGLKQLWCEWDTS